MKDIPKSPRILLVADAQVDVIRPHQRFRNPSHDSLSSGDGITDIPDPILSTKQRNAGGGRTISHCSWHPAGSNNL
jgi:hypothetical protein